MVDCSNQDDKRSTPEKYRLMQTDQRGACSGVSGTLDNLLVDDMVQRDAIFTREICSPHG